MTRRQQGSAQENSEGLESRVEPEEERRHWCFHIMVSGRYDEWRETQSIIPIEHQDEDPSLRPFVHACRADLVMIASHSSRYEFATA